MSRLLNFWICLYIFFSGLYAPALSADDFAMQRKQMVKLIEADVRATSLYLDKNALDPLVMQAIATVPRHKFVPENEQGSAYQNRPLAIGHGQTISQPYIVAIMTDLLKINAQSKGKYSDPPHEFLGNHS